MTEISRLTRAIRTGLEWDTSVGAVVPPIHVSTNYRFETPERRGGYDYSRSGNPTRDLLGTALGILEGGQPAVITGTGMGAVTTAVLACTEPGDTVAIPHDCYGGTWRLFARLAERTIRGPRRQQSHTLETGARPRRGDVDRRPLHRQRP